MDADRVRDRERMRKWKSIQSKPADHKRDWNQSRAVDVPLTRQRHQRGGYGRRQKYRDQHRNRVRRVVEEDDLRSSRRNASRSPRNHRDDYDMNGRRDRKRDSGFLLNNGKKVSYDSSEDTDDSSRDDSLKVHIGGQPCTQVKVTSSSSITCITPPGKGDAIPVVVITGGQSSEVYDWFEYDGPRIYASNPVQVQHKDDETTRLTFTGIHLGLDEDNGKVQALTVGGYPCINHKRDSAQQWSCDIEEKGRMGKMTPVQLHLPNRHRTSPPNETFAYFSFKAGPELTSNKPSFGPKEGGTVMVIQGVFGPSKPLSVAIQVGETACSTSIWMSPTEISCVIPEGKGHHLIAVEINGAKAELSKDAMGTPITWDYDPPIVDTVSPNSGTTQGNTLLSITGTFDGVASVTISGKACLIESTSHERVGKIYTYWYL